MLGAVCWGYSSRVDSWATWSIPITCFYNNWSSHRDILTCDSRGYRCSSVRMSSAWLQVSAFGRKHFIGRVKGQWVEPQGKRPLSVSTHWGFCCVQGHGRCGKSAMFSTRIESASTQQHHIHSEDRRTDVCGREASLLSANFEIWDLSEMFPVVGGFRCWHEQVIYSQRQWTSFALMWRKHDINSTKNFYSAASTLRHKNIPQLYFYCWVLESDSIKTSEKGTNTLILIPMIPTNFAELTERDSSSSICLEME